ncbi:patj homolog isoform X2 [Ceratitis capitata]|uniref:patj homolog isoform X2 n=1 Tax=Ceratitis capitata TaxID=7213 RepID=UPI000C6C4F94|nr:patj homolog isoform X2 [Ceratitis capitata]XP_023159351.1 patj homolog isoform X2 [Ceratitis capitata]XP_023159352.1 patj homolog isoform X2 [Ceratitis capitata]
MVLSTEWSQVEVIDLVNDGNGLGFILVGGRSTGVVIKALTPGGVAERDGRLQCGDHLLQIGDVNLRGFSSEQVATVLRQTGAQVRLIVARPVEPTAIDLQTLASHAPIIPTKLLSDPEELSRHLFQNPSFATSATSVGGGGDGGTVNVNVGVSVGGCFLPTPDTELADLPLPPIPSDLQLSASAAAARMCPRDLDIVPFSIVSPSPPPLLPSMSPTNATAMHVSKSVLASSLQQQLELITTTTSTTTNTTTTTTISTTIINNSKTIQLEHTETVIAGADAGTSTTVPDAAHIDADRCSTASSTYIDSPETETYVVELHKNVYGLGITVAGYVCEEEDLSGIFVKSIIEGSAAEVSGRIQINDRIVAVDGRSLAGVTNHQAVEILRNTDIEVHLTLERFLRGRKYEHLQNALTELKGDTQSQSSLPASPSIATLSWLPPRSDADSVATEGGIIMMEFTDFPSRETVDSNMSYMLDRSDHSGISSSKCHKTPTTPDKKHITNGKSTHINGANVDGNDNSDDQDSATLEDQTPAKESQTPKLAQQGGSQLNGSRKKSVISVAATATAVTTTTAAATTSKTAMTVTTTVTTVPAETTTTTTIASTTTAPTKPTGKSASTTQAPPSNLETLKLTWKSEFPESEIIVAEINKLSGLGISLEGTVDVEGGIEKRPHHYIRAILEDGPVGRQGILKPGDELLQVNEYKLQGLKHTEVVKILKELPTHVKLICARGPTAPSVINTSQNPEAFETRSLLPGGHQSLQNLLTTKAQSESSLYTSSTATLTDQQRSKSLENVSGLALWSSDITTIEIEKTEFGFGFSVLDYQDPLDAEGTVIVIRGLIRGGAAEATNEIFPGDRLVSVGEHTLQGIDLDKAVEILKGMPVGRTKLGICRPLSTSDSNIASPAEEGDSPST